jgi:hypothetical protein
MEITYPESSAVRMRESILPGYVGFHEVLLRCRRVVVVEVPSGADEAFGGPLVTRQSSDNK